MIKNNPMGTQASKYYVDACFLLTMTQANDSRYQAVIDFIRESGKSNVTYTISNHVYTEVYNNIFKFIVKRALSTFRRYQSIIHKKMEELTLFLRKKGVIL